MTEFTIDPGDALEFSRQWYDWLRGSDEYWTSRKEVRLGDTYTPQRYALNGRRYRCTIAGRTATAPPTWPTTSTPVTDGGVQWTLIGNEDRLATSAWTADAALTLSNESIDVTECVTEVKIVGGVAGQAYRVTNSITTDAGRTANRSFLLRVKDL